MNILPNKAEWKPHTETPCKTGIYFTFSQDGGLHQWGFDKKTGHWGNGIYTPAKTFRWLNVRIDMQSGFDVPC